MREIRFRAWNKFENRMIYPKEHIKDDVMVIRCLSGKIGYEWTSEGGGGVEDDDNLIPLQFTGLLDKNGKEIYEGDIIEDEFGQKDYVRFVDGIFCIISGFYPLHQWFGHRESVEIIGNIYENPELLKGL